jgi:hypothetical protein
VLLTGLTGTTGDNLHQIDTNKYNQLGLGCNVAGSPTSSSTEESQSRQPALASTSIEFRKKHRTARDAIGTVNAIKPALQIAVFPVSYPQDYKEPVPDLS